MRHVISIRRYNIWTTDVDLGDAPLRGLNTLDAAARGALANDGSTFARYTRARWPNGGFETCSGSGSDTRDCWANGVQARCRGRVTTNARATNPDRKTESKLPV